MLEQIGELLIHCKYGCMPCATEEGKHVVNAAGDTSDCFVLFSVVNNV